MKKYLWSVGLIIAFGLLGGFNTETVQNEMIYKVTNFV